MFSLFRRRPVTRSDVPRLTPRREVRELPRVNLEELTPGIVPYLAQAACVQLVLFESLSRAVVDAPTLASKESLAIAASRALDRYERLTAELRGETDDAQAAMQSHFVRLERYAATVRGNSWYELIATIYLAGGILDDFFALLSSGLEPEHRTRISDVVQSDAGREALVDILMDAMNRDYTLSSQLAMWGRRIVGDTLLVARAAIHHSDNEESDELRTEPVFTELIAAHSRRMDGLGLTA